MCEINPNNITEIIPNSIEEMRVYQVTFDSSIPEYLQDEN